MHGVGDARQALDDSRVVAGDRVTGQQAARVHGGGLDADQPGAALGPRRVVGDEVVGGQAVLDERRLVGRRDDAIAELDRPDLQGAQQQRVGHSGRGYVRLRARRRAGARARRSSRANCASAAVTTWGSSALPDCCLKALDERLAGEDLRQLHVRRGARDDAALDQDLLAAQPGRVARAIEALFMGADDLRDVADTGNAAHHALACGRVLLVGELVARAGRAHEREDAVGHHDCADIV